MRTPPATLTARGAASAVALCCALPLLGCRVARSDGSATALPAVDPGSAVERISRAILVQDEDGFADAARLCAQALSAREIIGRVRAVRGSGPVPHSSPNQHLEDALVSALVLQGDASVELLFRRARGDPLLHAPAARLVYTRLRSGDDLGPLSRYVSADDALGAALRDARAKAARFRARLPAADLADLQAIFVSMIPPKPQAVGRKRPSTELPWARSPYNPANWHVEALCPSDPAHPPASLTDRDVRTFWAPAAGASPVAFRITFPATILIENEVAYGIVILPGAKSSTADFEAFGRPTRIRIAFSDGTSKTADLDYQRGEPRGRVDFRREGSGTRRQALLQTAGPALLAKPRLRWRHWTRTLTFVVEDWVPGRRSGVPALSEVAIGPPAALALPEPPRPLRLEG